MTGDPYSSNVTPRQIADTLRTRSRVVVLTHAKPDGDALGASLAMVRALLRAGIDARAWLVGPWPAWTDTLADGAPVLKLGDQPPTLSAHEEPDAIVIVDTGSWSQLDQVRPFLEPRVERAIVIDHHLNGHVATSAFRLVDTHAAAACEVCAEVIDHLLQLQGGPFPADIARVLFLGIATDTGWFRFSNVTPRTLRLAARLIESGVDHPALYETINQQQSAGRIGLLARALSSMQFHADASVVLLSLTVEDFKLAGAEGEDTGGFADEPMSIAGVRVVATLTETTPPGDPHPLTKVSLRSKPGAGAVDVAAIAHRLGGGGHARAAGVKLKQPLDQARQTILGAIASA